MRGRTETGPPPKRGSLGLQGEGRAVASHVLKHRRRKPKQALVTAFTPQPKKRKATAIHHVAIG
jgi:hypothetical protein